MPFFDLLAIADGLGVVALAAALLRARRRQRELRQLLEGLHRLRRREPRA